MSHALASYSSVLRHLRKWCSQHKYHGVVGPLLFSLASQIFCKIRHCICFPQESEATAVQEPVPWTSVCSVQSAPPKPPAVVSDPPSTESWKNTGFPAGFFLLCITIILSSLDKNKILHNYSIYCSSGFRGVVEIQARFNKLLQAVFFSHLKFFLVHSATGNSSEPNESSTSSPSYLCWPLVEWSAPGSSWLSPRPAEGSTDGLSSFPFPSFLFSLTF